MTYGAILRHDRSWKSEDPSMIQTSIALAERFARDGFVVIEGLMPRALASRLGDRFELLFRGEFETGVWPDEWYWREGMSLPDVTRHMGNTWKCDRTVAGVVLSAAIGRLAAQIASWPGTRIGLDTLWWKPPGAKPVALHQDATYMASLDPIDTVTCWIALDDTRADAGTIEYVPGSHRWLPVNEIGEFHAPPGDHRARMRAEARALGIDDPQVVQVEVPAGSCVLHHGRVWHGSGRNDNATRQRRSIGVHLLRSDTRFRADKAAYVFGRYRRIGDMTMDESFFPITWTRDGYRSPWLADYCADLL
jgi:phytanoyl-CoA hydroxylase